MLHSDTLEIKLESIPTAHSKCFATNRFVTDDKYTVVTSSYCTGITPSPLERLNVGFTEDGATVQQLKQRCFLLLFLFFFGHVVRHVGF